ncbi:hypothetical protein I4U23_023617 [Adineta vaga]|nr:hypothetical protein I4U23_023617 [Adineta vaga]
MMKTTKRNIITDTFCVECNRTGPGLFPCAGCENSFCFEQLTKHFLIQFLIGSINGNKNRLELNTQLAVKAVTDDALSPIHLIKIVYTSSTTDRDVNELKSNTDCFETIAGPLLLSEENRLVTYIVIVNQGQSTTKLTKNKTQYFQTGDELLLTLDLDSRRLILLHERTKISDTLNVDLQKCPLPWQIAISMVGMNDQMRLIHEDK